MPKIMHLINGRVRILTYAISLQSAFFLSLSFFFLSLTEEIAQNIAQKISGGNMKERLTFGG